MMFIWKIDLFKIVFKKDDFLFLPKNDFYVFFKFKKNLVKLSFFVKTIFMSDFKNFYLKVVFTKRRLSRVFKI